ncbi:terminus macrodomain insulation protein YfbV [Lonsdalea quercina]|uniref:terminus macrodomain insulation protein YfbV n=1 Tax=Lonsdalea quercina TaxID=71657 RepID=UPI00397530AF
MTTNPTGKAGWFKLLQLGQHYMKTWPADKRLAPVFPENRVVRTTLFAVRFMPPLAVFTLSWQVALGGQLGPVVATALFALSLPMQGLWWLGRRAITPLPPSLLQWFHDIRQRLQEAGLALAPLEEKPTYQMLADVLKRAFKQLDKTFLDDL